jgi:oligosaccharyltransferase complex subunit epsilon
MKNFIEEVKNIDIIEQVQSAKEILSSFFISYKQQNSWKIRLIDSFIVFCGILLIIQFIYAFLNGLFPMNSLIAAMVVCIGSITLAGNINSKF